VAPALARSADAREIVETFRPEPTRVLIEARDARGMPGHEERHRAGAAGELHRALGGAHSAADDGDALVRADRADPEAVVEDVHGPREIELARPLGDEQVLAESDGEHDLARFERAEIRLDAQTAGHAREAARSTAQAQRAQCIAVDDRLGVRFEEVERRSAILAAEEIRATRMHLLGEAQQRARIGIDVVDERRTHDVDAGVARAVLPARQRILERIEHADAVASHAANAGQPEGQVGPVEAAADDEPIEHGGGSSGRPIGRRRTA